MTAPSDQITYRQMRSTDLDAAMELKSLAGWNQQRRDWALFLGFNPGGCFVACAGERVVGTVTTVDYERKVSWIGMVLVHPDFRRRGIGSGLLEAAIQSLARCDTIKLDATPAGKKLYDGLGFEDEYTLSRMTLPAWESVDVPQTDIDLTAVRGRDMPDIIAFDTPRFGVDRQVVLSAWAERTPAAAWVARRDGRVVGYAMGRPGSNFATIGPVVADSMETAQALIANAGEAFHSGPVCIDILDHTPAFQEWLENLGFAKQRPFIRMAKGPNRTPGKPETQWGAAGPEVG